MYKQVLDVFKTWKTTGKWDYDNSAFKEKWSNDVTFSDCDFLSAATEYLQLSIKDALESEAGPFFPNASSRQWTALWKIAEPFCNFAEITL